MRILYYLGPLILFFNCTRLGTLNLKDHYYNILPTKIIWIQVPGLLAEHLAMLRFSKPSSLDVTSFEKAKCIGQTWTYNLYNLRPSAMSGTLAQITGKQNIKKNCNDTNLVPIWSYLSNAGYPSAVLEVGLDDQESIDWFLECGDRGRKYINDIILWKMQKTTQKESKTFHVQEKNVFSKGNIYYDRSCQHEDRECFTSISRNIEYLFNEFTKDNSYYFFLIRDFSYLRSLKNKNVEDMRAKLTELGKVYKYFLSKINDRSRILLLLSTTAPHNFEFPKQGTQWATYEKTGKPILFHLQSLMGAVWAYGARSENFCGFYEEAEIFRRIIQGPGDMDLTPFPISSDNGP